MEQADVIIIGGGPAGSTCAGRLRAGGLDVLIVDKAEFPRGKLCSGWITPGVLDDLKLDIEDYRGAITSPCRVFQPMSGFAIGTVGGTSVRVDYGRTVSYGILRRQFDDYLLRRCGARLALGETVRAIERGCHAQHGRGKWTVNGQYQAPMLVAAGGHFCPVARLIGGEQGAESSEHGDSQLRARRSPLITAQELEIELTPDQESACAVEQHSPELYFCQDLLGYGWCFRKGNHLNVGLGRIVPQQLPQQVRDFYLWLKRQGRLPDGLPSDFPGHAYLTYDQAARPLAADGVVWIGDAAGLAHNESGEGIHPAIRSGLMAADAILAVRGDYRSETLDAYRRRMEAEYGRRQADVPPPRTTSAFRRRVAHWLLRRRWFVRRVVLDRWFLRRR